MKKLVKRVLLVFLAVVMLLGSFCAGFIIAQKEEAKAARIQAVALRGREYRRIIADIPSMAEYEDRVFLLDILNQGSTDYWDQGWVFTYEYAYTSSKGDQYTGLVENATWDMLIGDIVAMDKINLISASSDLGREVNT